MVVDYTLLTLVLGAVYALVKYALPDFPVSQEVLLALVIWAATLLGVEIVNRPVKAWLRRRGLMR